MAAFVDGGVAFAACVIEPVFGVEAFVGGIAFVVLLMLVFVARVTVVVAGVAEVVAGVAASCVVVWMSSVLVACVSASAADVPLV